MANSRPISRDATAPADDLLDEVVEAALIEATRETTLEPSSPGAPPESAAEAFLQRAVAFLSTHPDRLAILEKLRAAVDKDAGRSNQEQSDRNGAADGKPEHRDA